MNKIVLSENHRRAVSVSLFVVEAMLYEMERALKYPANGSLSKMETDISASRMKEVHGKIDEAGKLIQQLSEKYGLPAQQNMMSRFINARKVKIWEILCDTSAEN